MYVLCRIKRVNTAHRDRELEQWRIYWHNLLMSEWEAEYLDQGRAGVELCARGDNRSGVETGVGSRRWVLQGTRNRNKQSANQSKRLQGWSETKCAAESMIWRRGRVEARYMNYQLLTGHPHTTSHYFNQEHIEGERELLPTRGNQGPCLCEMTMWKQCGRCCLLWWNYSVVFGRSMQLFSEKKLQPTVHYLCTVRD